MTDISCLTDWPIYVAAFWKI